MCNKAPVFSRALRKAGDVPASRAKERMKSKVGMEAKVL